MNVAKLIALTGCLAAIHGTGLAAESDYPKFTVSGAAEYATGTYGGDIDIDDIYFPFSGTMDSQRFSLRLTVPYLSVSAPEGTVILGPGGQPIPGTGDRTTNSGLGDIIASATIYDVVYNRKRDFAIDLTGRVKFGTADVDKGLGTGETDYSVRADFLKFWEKFTLLGALGYKFRGNTADTSFNNVVTASAGATYKFTVRLRGGVFFDYRDSAISGNDSIQELSVFLSNKVSERWRLQVYMMTGFTDSSLDWGGGIRIKRVLPNRRDY